MYLIHLLMDSQRNLPIVTLSGIYIQPLESPTAGPYKWWFGKRCSFQTLAFLCISIVHGSCTNLSSALKLWAFKIQMTAKTTLQWWSLDNGDSFFVGREIWTSEIYSPEIYSPWGRKRFPTKWRSQQNDHQIWPDVGWSSTWMVLEEWLVNYH